MFESADEHWHRPTNERHWNESFYFNCFDAETGWACATRVGITPNANDQDGFICLYLPDQSTAFIRTSQAFDETRSKIASGKIEFSCIAPFQTWQIRYDGPIHHFSEAASDDDIRRTLDRAAPSKQLRLDLEIHALNAPVDYAKRSVRMRPLAEWTRGAGSAGSLRSLAGSLRTLATLPAMMKANHYEQSTKIRGIVTLDGKPNAIAGFGQRDHSWGVRDMRAPSSWRWLSCQFGEDLCFNATQVDVLGMRVQGGFVLHEGVTEALASWRYQATYGASAYWPDTLDVVLTARSGRRFVLQAQIIAPLPVIARTDGDDVVVTAARAKYRWGARTADGMVELMEKLR